MSSPLFPNEESEARRSLGCGLRPGSGAGLQSPCSGSRPACSRYLAEVALGTERGQRLVCGRRRPGAGLDPSLRGLSLVHAHPFSFLSAQGADGIRGLKGTKGEKVSVPSRQGSLAWPLPSDTS